jgi:hypothetical protein
MRGVYTAGGKIAGLNAAKTLFVLTAPAGKVVEILSVTVTQESNVTNFQFEAQIARITTLGTLTSYTALTPTPVEAGDQASGCTAQLAAAGSNEPTTYGAMLHQEGAASLVGYRMEPLGDADKLYVANGASIGVRMMTTPTSSDFDVLVKYREIG